MGRQLAEEKSGLTIGPAVEKPQKHEPTVQDVMAQKRQARAERDERKRQLAEEKRLEEERKIAEHKAFVERQKERAHKKTGGEEAEGNAAHSRSQGICGEAEGKSSQ